MQASLPEHESLGTAVDVVLRVAGMHGSSISLDDLLPLLPAGTSSEDVVTALESLPRLSARYSISGSLVVPRIGNNLHSKNYFERLRSSQANIQTARWFADKLRGSEVLTISVSGSTSYRAASKGDDVDLFCVTRRDMMWLFLVKALLLARTSRILIRSNAPICLSCIMDEEYAETLSTKNQGALFARDALVAEVIRGESHYARLVKSAPWMGGYFPKLYDLRNNLSSLEGNPKTSVSLWSRLLNLFIFFTLGSYIRAKARYHNRLLSRTGMRLSSFRVRIGLDYLIYESDKYLKLREIYDEIRPVSNGVRESAEHRESAQPVSNTPEPM